MEEVGESVQRFLVLFIKDLDEEIVLGDILLVVILRMMLADWALDFLLLV